MGVLCVINCNVGMTHVSFCNERKGEARYPIWRVGQVLEETDLEMQE